MTSRKRNIEPEALKARALLFAQIRQFFSQRGVLEVDVPLLASSATTEPHLDSFTVTSRWQSSPRYLITSPELSMKRLLASGVGSIYQLSHVFRDESAGRRHNPEFMLLEWYRVAWTYEQLMREVVELLAFLNPNEKGGDAIEYLRYGDALFRFAGVDLNSDIGDLRACAEKNDIQLQGDLGEDLSVWQDLLFTHLVEPRLGAKQLTFITHYPADRASLAALNDDGKTAKRFELYWRGVELANGFEELTDAVQQANRFADENEQRREAGLPEMPVDERFLQALGSGMPACSGVALGVDRLLMLILGKRELGEVMPFAWGDV